MEKKYVRFNIKTLVLGIGNIILRDDGIGPAIIRELEQFPCPPNVLLKTTNLSGMQLLDVVIGYDILIIVDAMQSSAKPGGIRWLKTEDFQSRAHTSSQHDIGILQVLELGKQLGMDVPADVRILAIEARDVTNFGEELTPEVAAAIPKAIEYIMRQIGLPGKDYRPAEIPISLITKKVYLKD
jgi:hydrogenase maturation protease